MELIARRQFAPLYIWLDLAFLLVYCVLLLRRKQYMTVIVGFVMGIVYMLVDTVFSIFCSIPAQYPRGTACSGYCSGCP